MCTRGAGFEPATTTPASRLPKPLRQRRSRLGMTLYIPQCSLFIYPAQIVEGAHAGRHLRVHAGCYRSASAVGDGDRPGVGLCGRGRWAQPAANAPRMRIAQPPGRERKTTAPRASAIREEEEAPAKRIQRGVDARRARWPSPPAPARREIRSPRRRSHEDTARFLRKNLIKNTHTHTTRVFSHGSKRTGESARADGVACALRAVAALFDVAQSHRRAT